MRLPIGAILLTVVPRFKVPSLSVTDLTLPTASHYFTSFPFCLVVQLGKPRGAAFYVSLQSALPTEDRDLREVGRWAAARNEKGSRAAGFTVSTRLLRLTP